MPPPTPSIAASVPPWPAAKDGSPRAKPRLPLILLYHSISDPSSDLWGVRVSPENFAQHMQVLATHCTPMRLRDLDAALREDRVPPRAVVVTFDDGYVDNLLHAKPAMERFNVPGSVFVASGYIGQQREYWWDEIERLVIKPGRMPHRVTLTVRPNEELNWNLGWDARLGPLKSRWQRRNRYYAYQDSPQDIARHTPRQRMYRQLWDALRYAPSVAAREAALAKLSDMAKPSVQPRPSCMCCTADQLRQLASGNLIEIGAHTVNHPSLGQLSEQEQRFEIFESKRTLEAIVGKPVVSFTYPFGGCRDFNDDTLRLLREAGFKQACTNLEDRGPVPRDVDRLQYSRLIANDWDAAKFVGKLSEWFDKYGH